jgi:hypothetical protein
MRFIVIVILFCAINPKLIAQQKPQLRFKPGISLLFPSPGGTGFAYKNASQTSGSVVIGGEFSHPFKNKKVAWQIGFTFQDSYQDLLPNKKNILPPNLLAPNNFGFRFYGSPAKTVVYAGLEKRIGRSNNKISKNYFSAVGGSGFAFSLNKYNDWSDTIQEKYFTRNGGILEGRIASWKRPKFPLAPCVYGGLRYNITNRKGNEILISELMVNYGLTSFYDMTIDYKLNGTPKQDKLKEKGVCIELNIIVPVFTFNKKRKK